jgi:hypothetical protein
VLATVEKDDVGLSLRHTPFLDRRPAGPGADGDNATDNSKSTTSWLHTVLGLRPPLLNLEIGTNAGSLLEFST